MTITLDDGAKAEVWVSDSYLDQATPVKVKEATIKILEAQSGKQKEIEELLARAKELGIDLGGSGAAPVAAQPQASTPTTPAKQAKAEPTPFNEDVQPEVAGARIIDSVDADKAMDNLAVDNQTGGQAGGMRQAYEVRSDEEASEDLRGGEKDEINTVRVRDGMSIAIPTRRVGKMGETKIQIVDSGGDSALQERFKSLNGGDGQQSTAGYTVRSAQCGLCRGQGVVMGSKKCPKCGGAGMVDISS